MHYDKTNIGVESGNGRGPLCFQECGGDGLLRIYVNPDNPDALDELRAIIEKGHDYHWHDILDSCGLIGNDWYEVDPSDIGAMTEAPIIAWGEWWDDSKAALLGEKLDENRDYEKIWFYKDYMILDPIAEIIERGEVFFTLA